MGALAIKIAAGAAASCAIEPDNDLLCWGSIETGSGGNISKTPALIPGKWIDSAIGERHACGVRLDGTLACWGANDRGLLGDGTFEYRTTPVRVGIDSDWARVVAGREHSCASKTDGRLFCWGDNEEGQLGTGAGWVATLLAVELD